MFCVCVSAHGHQCDRIHGRLTLVGRNKDGLCASTRTLCKVKAVESVVCKVCHV